MYLYNDSGITKINGIKQACKERAVADLLYFFPGYYIDNSRWIDWEKVDKIQKEVGYK
ncbi:MAG: hypothetical protein ABEH43_05170 [Flavobacteriales bacterium]